MVPAPRQSSAGNSPQRPWPLRGEGAAAERSRVLAAGDSAALMPLKQKRPESGALVQRRRATQWFSRRIWRRRLVFWLGALGAGIVGVIFAEAADWCQSTFSIALWWSWWLPLFLTPAGFTACAYLCQKFFPGSQGSGIPQAIAARNLRNTPERRRLISAKLILAKLPLRSWACFAAPPLAAKAQRCRSAPP